MWSEHTTRGRILRTVVLVGGACLVAVACGFSRDGIQQAKAGGNDSIQLTDGLSADTDLTDSGLTPFSDSSSSTDSFTDYTDSSSTDSSPPSPPVDATPLIPLVVDPPGLPPTPPRPGPPAREDPAPDGTQKPVNGTYTYDNLDDFLFGDWSCLECTTEVTGFGGAVDKLGRTLDDRYTSASMARFADATGANRALREVTSDRQANASGIWQTQFPSVPGIPGAKGSLSEVTPTGQDYEVRFVVKTDLYIIDFGSPANSPVDQTAANSFALLQFQKASG